MDLKLIRILSKSTNVSLPKNIKTKNKYWYVNNGSSAGGIAVFKKYRRIGGDPEYRKKKWFEWWEREGKHKINSITRPKPIRRPMKSIKLAELIGILIGDGGITNRQITITLNHIDDKEYSKFVIKLIKKLFNIKPSVYHDVKNSVNDIVVSRSELVKFFVLLGLPIGNKVKQQIDIPKWIKTNKNFLIACLRGLVDTDGCVIKHSYKVNGKVYNYKKLAFSSQSKPLIKTVYNSLKKFGFSARITKYEKDVRIESKSDMQKYFKLIGSHNPKHLRKYYK